MEDEGADRTVIYCWQNQLGRMADFPPLLVSSVFDLLKHDLSQIAWKAVYDNNCHKKGIKLLSNLIVSDFCISW